MFYIVYTILFVLYSVLEVTGALPQEFKSEGISLVSLFKRYYGDEDIDFISYHIKRTTAAIVIHSSLPLIYTIGLLCAHFDFNLLNASLEVPPTICRLLLISMVCSAIGLSLWLYYYMSNWDSHPIAKILSKYDINWRNVASSVNAEYRRIDKFVSETGPNKVIVTHGWIIKCRIHRVQLIKQDESIIKLTSVDELRANTEGRQIQFLTINITSSRLSLHQISFNIRLKSEHYASLKDNLTVPIQVDRQVTIQQSLTDQFFKSFEEQVALNGTYALPPDTPPLEPCLGCSQALPQVKLHKMCTSANVGECRQCSCRPMWCMACMSRWFVSRQDQHHPEVWLEGVATCPMCRQTFCMLDILKIE